MGSAGVKRKRASEQPLLDGSEEQPELASPQAAPDRATLESLGIPHCLDLVTDHKTVFHGKGEFASRSALVIADAQGKIALYVPKTKARLDISQASSLFTDVMRQAGLRPGANQPDAHTVCYEETSHEVRRGITQSGGRLRLDDYPCGIASFESGNKYSSRKAARTSIYMTLCLAWFLMGYVDEWWEATAPGVAPTALTQKALTAKKLRQAADSSMPDPPELTAFKGATIASGEGQPSKATEDITVHERSHSPTKGAKAKIKVASDFWRQCVSPKPSGTFSIVVLDFELDATSSLPGVPSPGAYRPLAVLTRKTLPLPPDQEPIQLFDFFGLSIACRIRPETTIDLDPEQTSTALSFTRILMQAVTSRAPSPRLEDYPYLVLPASKSAPFAIAWKDVEAAISTPFIAFDLIKSIAQQSEDAMINIPETESGKSYFVEAVRRDIDLNTTPEDVGLSPFVDGIKFETLYDMQAAKAHYFGNARLRPRERLIHVQQPVLQLRRLPPAVNMCMSQQPAASSFKPETKYRWPEVTSYRSLPKSVFLSAQTLPTVMTLLDDMLLAREVNAKYLDDKAKDADVMIALSAPSALRCAKYERLEFLGDSFLRFAIGAYFFNMNLEMPKNLLTQSTRAVTDNRPLRAGMERCGATRFVRCVAIVPHTYSPERHIGVGDSGLVEQPQIGIKPIADVSEALLAAVGLHAGPEETIQTLRNLGGMLPGSLRWADFRPIPSDAYNDPPTVSDQDFEAISTAIGYRFKDRRLLALALSSHNVDRVHFGRLSFLGSGTLKYLITRDLFDLDLDMDPLAFTLWKTLLVSPEGIAVATHLLGLVSFLRPQWTEQQRNDVDKWQKEVREAAMAKDGSIRSTWITFKTISVRQVHRAPRGFD